MSIHPTIGRQSLLEPAHLRAELAAVVEQLLEADARGEPTWYVWGGSGSPAAGLDCSGLVVWAARQLGIDDAPRWNTDRIWWDLEPIGRPEPGDLALYGRGAEFDPASHVMVVLGPGALPPIYRVAGMSGGGRKTTSLEVARKQGAKLKAYPSHCYRRDFIGFRRLPFERAVELHSQKEK